MVFNSAEGMTFTEAKVLATDITNDDSLKKTPEEINKIYDDILGESRNERGLLKEQLKESEARILRGGYEFFVNDSVENKSKSLASAILALYKQKVSQDSDGSDLLVGNAGAIEYQLTVLKDRIGASTDKVNADLAKLAFANKFPDRNYDNFLQGATPKFDLLNSGLGAKEQYKLLTVYVVEKYFAGNWNNDTVKSFVAGNLTLPQLETQGRFAVKNANSANLKTT